MATPQQPPQQPIYPRDLSLALDRNFTKLTSYTDGRFESLAAQMRIGYEESLMRDNDLANNMRTLADTILRVAERVGNIETQVATLETRVTNIETRVTNIESKVTNIENTQQIIMRSLEGLERKVTEGFAAQAERHNELILRVDRIERNRQS